MYISNKCKVSKVMGAHGRYALDSILIKKDGVFAGNGKVMIHYRGENDCEGSMAGDQLKALQFGGKKHGVKIEGGKVSNTKVKTSSTISGETKWPDPYGVIPPEDGAKDVVRLNAGLLLDMLQAMGADDEMDVDIRFYGEDKPVRIDARDATGLIMPVTR